MTRVQLRRAIFVVIGIYTLAFVIGIVLRIAGSFIPFQYYETFRDLIPFILAIPAAYLGYCFQQRGSYLESLRLLWSKLVYAVNQAVFYTYKADPSCDEYTEILMSLSIVIDEIRGAYRNLGERLGKAGVYPYEPVKVIYNEINDLGFGTLHEDRRTASRATIMEQWKLVRESFLSEFDRAEPASAVSPYVDK